MKLEQIEYEEKRKKAIKELRNKCFFAKPPKDMDFIELDILINYGEVLNKDEQKQVAEIVRNAHKRKYSK